MIINADQKNWGELSRTLKSIAASRSLTFSVGDYYFALAVNTQRHKKMEDGVSLA
jgi:hypothetical protein